MDGLLQSAQPLLAPAFSLWGSPVTWLEMLAFVLSLAMVVCNIRVNLVAWPLAIAASLLYFLLFWDSRLYGEASLQIFFAVVAGWGWWQWLRGREADGSALRVRYLSGRARLGAAGRGGAGLAAARRLPAPGHRHRRALVGRACPPPAAWPASGCSAASTSRTGRCGWRSTPSASACSPGRGCG